MRSRTASGRLVAALMAVTLLSACDSGDGRTAAPVTDPGADTTTSAQPQAPAQAADPTGQQADPRLPRRPPSGDATALSEDLGTAHRLVQDPDTGGAELRRAAEYEQLAARMLALGPDGYRHRVLARLDRPTRVRTRAHVQAATLLGAMTEPQPELPDWRVVEPPSPGELRAHYRAAQQAIGVPWEYLAAIHLVETRMGRIRGVSTAGAQGPMQFLPTTWELYGEGGDIEDVGDAVMAAARLLRAHGAPDDVSGALWHYNPSDRYVEAVELYAAQIRREPATYHGYWHWRVLYKHVDGTMVLEPGYPQEPAIRLR